MNAHARTLTYTHFGGWWTRCSCGWESPPEQTRPEAIRHHTIHTHTHMQGAAR